MPPKNDDQNNDQNNNADNQDSNNDQKPDDQNTDIAKLIQEQVETNLKPIKESLDKAYKARDEALLKIKEFERKEREAEIKRLEEEGKHKEVYEMKLAEEKAARESAERRNVELTRDLEVRNVLGAQPFRNDNALEMAYKEIVGQLVRNEQGVWVHKSGVNIKDFIKTFAENNANEFLFKPKVSSGSGSSQSRNAASGGDDNKSLFKMSQEDVLKLAREGKLRGR